MIYLDDNLDNSDWIRTLIWELPADPTQFRAYLFGQRKTLKEFMALPAAKAMPESLRTQLLRPVKD